MKRMKEIAIFAGFCLIGASASADDFEFKAELSGNQAVPPIPTTGTGEAEFEVNEELTAIKFKLKAKDFDGIVGAIGAHIHCAPAGANGPIVVFLSGMVPGGFDDEFETEATLTDANIIGDTCGANLAELVDSMLAGDTYVNVHSIEFPFGEIRGQIFLDD